MTAPARWDTLTYTNPKNWDNTNYSSLDVQVLAFPIGYQITPQEARSYFSINASIVNSTHFNANISTGGKNQLNILDFSIIMFDRTPIVANYSVYEDVAIFSVYGNGNVVYYNPTISTSEYMFRNCLTGAVHVEFNLSAVPYVGYYYSYSTQANNVMVWRTFNNRKRSCPANMSYYNPVTVMCQDICLPYYFTNIPYMACLACHFSCYNCSK